MLRSFCCLEINILYFQNHRSIGSKKIAQICRGLCITFALSTAFRLKEIYEFPQHFELWHTIQCAALSYLPDQSHRNQPVNMMGQGGVGYAKLVLDLSHRRTFITDFHKVSKNQKSSVVP